jgi:hypothetical protein
VEDQLEKRRFVKNLNKSNLIKIVIGKPILPAGRGDQKRPQLPWTPSLFPHKVLFDRQQSLGRFNS